MSCRTIRLLHVEDDPAQRRFMAHHLSSIGEYQFDINSVESEDEAIDKFDGGGFGFIILDYQLTAGDGKSCLEKLRNRDRIVPIIAISGLATPEIALEMLGIGVDDFISKKDLSGQLLAQSLREAMARANAWRIRTRKRAPRRKAREDLPGPETA